MPRPTFEFDPGKSEINKAKHGIDFIEAQALWDSPRIELPAKEAREKRYLEIGTIKGDYWSGIVTYVGAKIRLISVRRSTAEEIALFVRAQKASRAGS